MTSKKKPDFLSQLSKDQLKILKNKLARDKNESCPINTLNQLLQNPLAVPKLNDSLRSLRCKPCRPPPPPPADYTSTPPPAPDVTMDFGISSDIRRETGLQNDTNQPSNVGNNESIFAVPTMRAPRSVKNVHSNILDRCSKAALSAFIYLDNATIDKLFSITILDILALVEDCAPGTSEVEKMPNNEVIQLLNRYIEDLAEEIEDEGGDSGYPDTDNMTSVSGYPPYPYMNQFGNQTNYAPGVGKSMPMFMRPATGSTVGTSIYQPRNDTFMNQSFARPMTQGTGRMLPSFFNSSASVVGSMYDQPFMNQTSVMHNQPLFGYPPHAMPVRSEASMYRPLRDVQNNTTTIMNHGAFLQNPQARLLRENHSMSYNTGNVHRVPSVVGGNNRMNFAGEDEENMYGSNARDQMLEKLRQSNRKMLSPLLPVIELQRLDPETIREVSNRPDTTLKTIKTTTYKVQKVKDAHSASIIQKSASLLNRTAMNNTTRLRQGLSSTVRTPLRGTNLNDSRVIRVTRSGRAVRAPQTYFASEISSITQHNETVQMRGSKRKRGDERF